MFVAYPMHKKWRMAGPDAHISYDDYDVWKNEDKVVTLIWCYIFWWAVILWKVLRISKVLGMIMKWSQSPSKY